jgi:hypothetical protein
VQQGEENPAATKNRRTDFWGADLRYQPRDLTDLRYQQEDLADVVKFWYLGKWSPSVIDVPNTKRGKVPLPHFTLCYKVKATL